MVAIYKNVPRDPDKRFQDLFFEVEAFCGSFESPLAIHSSRADGSFQNWLYRRG